MASESKIIYILRQLKEHAPFTFIGALLGVGFMLAFRNMPGNISNMLFNGFFHPAHVVLSAIATAAMYKLHVKKASILTLLVIGWVGSIGVATLSDTVIPHLTMRLFGIEVKHHHGDEEGCADKDCTDDACEKQVHTEQACSDKACTDHACADDHSDCDSVCLPFIDEWYIVNPAAILGVLIAVFWPNTKFPHFGHVLLSIWASLMYLLSGMAGQTISIGQWVGISATLFLAVWLPCCISDIVFPLLFVKPGEELPESCCH